MGTTESMNSPTVAGTSALGKKIFHTKLRFKKAFSFYHLILSEVFSACIVAGQVFPIKNILTSKFHLLEIY